MMPMVALAAAVAMPPRALIRLPQKVTPTLVVLSVGLMIHPLLNVRPGLRGVLYLHPTFHELICAVPASRRHQDISTGIAERQRLMVYGEVPWDGSRGGVTPHWARREKEEASAGLPLLSHLPMPGVVASGLLASPMMSPLAGVAAREAVGSLEQATIDRVLPLGVFPRPVEPVGKGVPAGMQCNLHHLRTLKNLHTWNLSDMAGE